ncbi:MAG TPA: DUF4390 domain-containing protein [Burkholderiales bacterium]|nr:DUF4390 domain-containing protein [Burkholderiales bacterium]
MLLALVIGAAALAPALAQGIEVKRPTVTIENDHLMLDVQFDIALTSTLEEVLSKGVPLHFVLEFDLIRPRWYWFNERVLHFQQEYRLSYNALTRQYRLAVGNLHQNHSTLAEALEVMSRVRRRYDVDPGSLRRDIVYQAAVRFRLDTAQLPKPFQLSALVGREWNVGSDWYRWQVSP